MYEPSNFTLSLPGIPRRCQRCRWGVATAVAAGVAAWVIFAATSAWAARYKNPHDVLDLAGIWLFHPGDSPLFADPSFDDIDWEQRRVPTRYNKWGDRWQGFGWYRLHLQAMPGIGDKNMVLSLASAREIVDVYVNGALVAQRGRFGARMRGGAHVLALQAHIPAGLLHAGDNLVAVRVYDLQWTCGLPEGPILLGPPDLIHGRVDLGSHAAFAIRFVLCVLAFIIALEQVLVYAIGRAVVDHWWIAATGVCLSVFHASGTGLLTRFLPLPLASRLPPVALTLSIMCMGSYFAARFEDHGAAISRWLLAIFAVLGAALFLAPDMLVHWAAEPAMLVGALLVTLYSANLLSRAARRQEEGTTHLFVGMTVLVVLFVYDGWVASALDALPPWSTIGAVFVLGLVVVGAARRATEEYDLLLSESMVRRRNVELREPLGSLEAAYAAMEHPARFLGAVVQQLAQQLAVRRCSFIMARKDGALFVTASVGLPRHAYGQAVSDEKSVAYWVYQHRTALTEETLPSELGRSSRDGAYFTDAFIAFPVSDGSLVVGVINATDRNDGGSFAAGDHALLDSWGRTLARVLIQTKATVEKVLGDVQEQAASATPQRVPLPDEAAEQTSVESPPEADA